VDKKKNDRFDNLNTHADTPAEYFIGY